MSNRYKNSEELLSRATGVIPLGAQTFSKSITQLPLGAAPLFADRADGAHLWDVDGNQYLDFVNGLAAILLGYRDTEVDSAVRAQMERGVSFSLSHSLETQLAEQIVRLVPCAEQVRFGKNGTDATTAAVRLARAVTGRDRIALCGYHGWQDWSIAVTTRNSGIPDAVASLSHSFQYGDSQALEALLSDYRNEFAAVIMEPANASLPPANYLPQVRDIAHSHGALLIFDETITGFRYHCGGAQALFAVTPDLATLGKGMANGYPLSAVVGRSELMQEFEQVFFSGTFGGETLSLAAALAALKRIERDDIPGQLNESGIRLARGINEILDHTTAGQVFALSGHPSWSFLQPTNREYSAAIKTLLIQELCAAGILCLGTHNLSAAHTHSDIDQLVNIYSDVLPKIADATLEGRVEELLNVAPLKPLFRVR